MNFIIDLTNLWFNDIIDSDPRDVAGFHAVMRVGEEITRVTLSER